MITLLLIIGIVLFVLWLLGTVMGRVFGGLIHLAFLVALVLVIIWLVRVVF